VRRLSNVISRTGSLVVRKDTDMSSEWISSCFNCQSAVNMCKDVCVCLVSDVFHNIIEQPTSCANPGVMFPSHPTFCEENAKLNYIAKMFSERGVKLKILISTFIVWGRRNYSRGGCNPGPAHAKQYPCICFPHNYCNTNTSCHHVSIYRCA
jgi:hypothetical protein